MNQIKESYLSHYGSKFAQHGEKPEGVDWGPDPKDLHLRLERVLAVMEKGGDEGVTPSLLEVGCGYGSMWTYLQSQRVNADFTGIDLCEPMVLAAKARFPEQTWMAIDVFEWDEAPIFDYVVCNGLVNLKLDASLLAIKEMAKRLLSKMFALSRVGCSLNFMTSNVNYFAPHLYYQNPVELLGWCMTELTTKVRIDHAYSLYEFTIHLYHEDSPGLSFGSHRVDA